MTGKKVLVTGCSGLLGVAVCERLLQTDVAVFGLDKVHPPASRVHDIIDSINMITADVRDFKFLCQLVEKEEIEFIYHLAAQAIVGEAAKSPIETFQDNIAGTWNVLEAARLRRATDSRLTGVIVASSDKAYGDQAHLPYFETAPLQGRFPYDVSKSCADLLAQSYFHSYSLPVCIVRCGNLYGAGDLNFSRIIPGTILSLLRGEHPLIRSDGEAIRDYVYVKDAADAYATIAEAMEHNNALHGEAFNIGDNHPMSVLQVVSILQKLMKCQDLDPVILNTASLEIRRQYLSSAKIKDLLGWHSSYTLEEGLNETLQWYRQYHSRLEA